MSIAKGNKSPMSGDYAYIYYLIIFCCYSCIFICCCNSQVDFYCLGGWVLGFCSSADLLFQLLGSIQIFFISIYFKSCIYIQRLIYSLIFIFPDLFQIYNIFFVIIKLCLLIIKNILQLVKLRIMKKTYSIQHCLNEKQIQQFNLITKKLLQAHLSYGLIINSEWKINIMGDMIELELLGSPVNNYKIKINPILPSISNIIRASEKCVGKQPKIYRLSDVDSIFHQIVNYINNLLKKNTNMLNQYKQIQLDLGILGYFRFTRFQVDYHNAKGLLKWSLISRSEGCRLKLDQIANLSQVNQNNQQNHIMNRKFSSSSFKDYNLSNSLSKQKPNASLTKSRARINSLPSITNEQAKQNHKKVLNNLEKIKQNQSKINSRANKSYLKIDQAKKRKLSTHALLFMNLQKYQSIQTNFNTYQNCIKQPQTNQSNQLSQEKKQEKSVHYSQQETKRKKSKLSKIEGIDTLLDLMNVINQNNQIKQENYRYEQDSLQFSITKKSITINSQQTQQVQSGPTLDLNISKNTIRKSNLSCLSHASNLSKYHRPSRGLNPIQNIKLTEKLKLNSTKKINQYESLIQQQQQAKAKQRIKNNIMVLLSGNQQLKNDNALIQQLYQITRSNQSNQIPHKKIINKIPQKKLTTHKLNKQQLIHIQDTICDRHKNNSFMQRIIQQIQSKFSQIYIKSFKTIDCSDAYFINSLDLILQTHRQIKKRIKAQIQLQVQVKFQKRTQNQQIKQKFNRYKYYVSWKPQHKSIPNQFILDELATKNPPSPAQLKINEDFIPEVQKGIKKIIKDYQIDKYEDLQAYYYQNHYMPYFYVLGQLLIQLFVRCFDNINDPVSAIYIQLKDINTLNQALAAHLSNIMNLYNRFISFFEQIPHKMFRASQFHINYIKNRIQKRKKSIQQCQKQWQKQIKQIFHPFETYLSLNKKKSHSFSQQFKKCSDKIMLSEREEHIYQIQQKYQKLILCKTFFKSTVHILDTNHAKLDLMQKYQRQISNIYNNIYAMLCSISQAWSQQMARTERLLPDELAEEELQISAKIRYLTKNYIKLVKTLFINRKYFYFPNNQSQIYQASPIILKLTQRSPKRSRQQTRISKELTKSKSKTNNQFDNKNSLSQIFYKCLNISYNMCKKNQEKIIQINFLVQRHKQKMIFVSKILQQKQKQQKKESQQIGNQLRKILKEIKTRLDLLKVQHKIKQIQTKFKIYQQRTKKLHEQMSKNGMIVWQEDDYLQNNINICLRTISFMDSDIYMRINYNSIDSIRFQHFYKYYKSLEKLISGISGHKFQELFKNEYDLSKKQFQLIQMALYKDYDVSEIEQIYNTLSLDLRPTLTTIKVSDILKQFRNKPSLYKDLCRIYLNRKRQKYNRNLGKDINIQIQISQYKEQQIAKILNYEQIKIQLIDEINNGNLPKKQKQTRRAQLEILQKLIEVYNIIYENQIIMRQISSDMKEEEIVNIFLQLDKVKLHYHNALNSFKVQKNFCISRSNLITDLNYKQKQWQKLIMLASQLEDYKVKNKLYIFLSQLCPRLVMVSYKDLIHLMDWSTHFKILKNIKILFSEVIDVQFGQNNSIVAIYVSKQNSNDRIEMSCGPINTQKQDKKGKLIRIIEKQVHKSLLSMISNSIGRAGQVKLLHWHLYLTQQVQQSIITNSSLKILQSRINETINSIKFDLRYDINNHKSMQISQLNTFYHYISDCLGQFPNIDGYQWISTIRAYQKNNCVMIQQNNLQFYYGFEPKSARILHPLNWDLSLSVSYADNSLSDVYKYKAYIIGAPYFEIKQFSDSYLTQQKNISKFIQLLQVNRFICSIVEPDIQQQQNRAIYNQIHKQILNYINIRNKKFKLSESMDQIQDKDEVLSKSDYDVNQLQVRSIRKPKKVCTINGMIQQSNNKYSFIHSKGRFSVHLCYQQYARIPPYFLNFYRCRNVSRCQPFIIALKINLMVQKSRLPSQLKQKLIWKLIKLTQAVNEVKYSSYQELQKLINKILQMIQTQHNVTKDVKNSIYNYIIEYYISDYVVAAGIVNEVFNLEQFQSISSSGDVPESTQIMKPGVTMLSRKSVLQSTKKQYESIKSSKYGKKKVIIYGQQPTCKSTFIQQNLQLKLGDKKGYIEASLIQTQLNQYLRQSMGCQQCSNQKNNQHECQYSVIEAGSLGQIIPSILSVCILLYIPSMPAQNNNQYMQQLKQHFCLTIINTNQIITTKIQTQKLWEYMEKLYELYRVVQNKEYALKINCFVDQLLKVFCYFLTMGNAINDVNVTAHQTKLKSKKQLFFIITYQLLLYSLTQKSHRKTFIQQVKKLIIIYKNDLKLQQIQSITYSKNGEIIKFDSNTMNKHLNNSTRKEMMFLIPLITREVAITNRYIDAGLSICIFGNSQHMFRQLCTTVSQYVYNAGLIVKNQFRESSNRNFVVYARMQTIKTIYNKLGIIYEKKRQRLDLSKVMVSGKIMQMSASRNMLQSSQRIKTNIPQKTIILVDDLHMSNIKNAGQLAAVINRLNNSQTCRQVQQIFILFKRNNYKDRPSSNRLRRFTIQITLPDLQLQNIFKYRSQTMMNQQQFNLPTEVFNLGLFNQKITSNGQSPLIQKNSSKQKLKAIQNQAYIDFSMETTLKMSSQLYQKYVMNKLCHLSLSGYHMNLPHSNNKPKDTIKDLVFILEKSQLTSKLAQKLIPKTFSNFYIVYKNQKFVELDWKLIKNDVEAYLSQQSFQRRILGQIYCQYLPLIISTKISIIKSDNYNILAHTYAFVQQKTIRNLTHNFLKQICQNLSMMYKDKQKSVIFIIPEYLLYYSDLRGFLRSVIHKKEIFIQNQELFEFWWELVSQQQFIENRYDQYQAIKADIQQIFNRISFIISIQNLSLSESVHFLIEQQQIIKQNTQSTKNILQTNLEKHLPGPKIQKSKKTKDYEYYRSKDIILINTQLSLQQQIACIDKIQQYYKESLKPSEAVIKYINKSIEYLKTIVEYSFCQDQSSTYSDTMSEEQIKIRKIFNNNHSQSYILFEILEAIPRLFAIAIDSYNKSNTNNSNNTNNNNNNNNTNNNQFASVCSIPGTMLSITQQQKLTIPQLIENLKKKLSQLSQKTEQKKNKLKIVQEYHQKLMEDPIITHQFYKQQTQKTIERAQQNPSNRTTSQKNYINEQYSRIKTQYLQSNTIHYYNQVINQYNLQQLKNMIMECFQSQKENDQFVFASDYVVELYQGFSNIKSYLEFQINFIRFVGINDGFRQLMCQITYQQYNRIRKKLTNLQNYISNITSFIISFDYAYKISQFFKKHLKQQKFQIDNIQYDTQFLTAEYKFIEYMNILDVLSICNDITRNLKDKIDSIRKVEDAVENCINFLVEISNFYAGDQNNNGLEKNYDIFIKLKMYELISNSVLSKMKKNLRLHYQIHKDLQLQSTPNILFSLQHPKLMYPYKWQQIQNQIFTPLIQNRYEFSKKQSDQQPQKAQSIKKVQVKQKKDKTISFNRNSILNSRRLTHEIKRISIDFNQKEKSQNLLKNTSKQTFGLDCWWVFSTKYAIVHDPYSQFTRYLQSGCQSVVNSYRKIVYLKNYEGKFGQCMSNNEKLLKLNHLSTFFIYYFKVDLAQLSKTYIKSLKMLNKILKILTQKQQKGQGQNDRLIILIQHKFLCNDIKQNAQFIKNMNQENDQQTINRRRSLSTLIQIVSLQPTQMDILQYFKHSSKQKDKKIQDRSRKYHQQQKQLVFSKGGLNNIRTSSVRNLENMHNEYNMSKNYLKMLMKSVADRISQNPQITISQTNLPMIMKVLQQYQTRKNELLSEYCQQKLFNYDYFLQVNNLQALWNLYQIFSYLLANCMVPMDFISSIGDYVSIQSVINQLFENEQTGICKSIKIKSFKGKSVFYETQSVKKFSWMKSFQKTYELIIKNYKQYKNVLNKHIYCVNRDSAFRKQKLFNQIIEPYQIFILIYDNFENWVVKQLLQRQDRNKIRLIFDNEPNCYDIYLQTAMTPIKQSKRIIFLTHLENLENVRKIMHSVKIFWI